MAAATTFKQQCPSCEAMVSIKDNMIGKKVECHKCKDKFVAKKPADDEDDIVDVDIEDEEETGKKDTKLTAKKKTAAANGKRPKLEVDEDEDEEDEKPHKNGKAKSATNGKPPKKTAGHDDEEDDEEDDEDEEGGGTKKKTKEGGKSKKLIIGLSLAGVGVVILVVAAVIIGGGFGGRPRNNPSGPGFVKKDGDKKDDDNNNPPPPKVEKPADPVVAALTDAELAKLSNLLPNDTEHVFRVAMRDLFAPNSSLRNAVFDTPGALNDGVLRKSLGFSVLALDDIIVAEKYTAPGWKYTVLHFNDLLSEKDLKSALNLQPATASDGQTYFKLTKPNPAFDHLARFSFGIPNDYRYFDYRSDQTSYLRLHNSQTLIVGDAAPVLAFLKAKGQFPLQTTRTPIGPGPDKNPMPPKDGVPTPPGPAKGALNFDEHQAPRAHEAAYYFTSFEQGQGLTDAEIESVIQKLRGTTWEGTEDGAAKLRLVIGIEKFATVTLDSEKTNLKGQKASLGVIADRAKNPGLDKLQIFAVGTLEGATYLVSLNGNKMTGTATRGIGKDMKTWPVVLQMTGGGDTLPPQQPDPKGAPKIDPKGDPKIDVNPKDPTPGPTGASRDDMYLTIKPSLKAMLDKMETRPNEKDKILLSSATDMDANCIDFKNPAVAKVWRLPRQFWDVSLLLYEAKPRIRFLGTSLVQRDTLRYQLRNELNCAQAIDAEQFQKEIIDRTALQVAKFIQQLVKHEVKLPAPVIMKKTPPPDAPPPPPPGGKDQPKPEEKQPEAVLSQMSVNQQGTTVEFFLDLVLDNSTLTKANAIAALGGGMLRVEIEAAARSPRHTLADAGRLVGAKGLPDPNLAPRKFPQLPKGQFPPGVFQRTNSRAYTDKEPRNRISWMAGLLPYMGHQSLYNKIQFDQSWRDSENWMAGHAAVPQFLDPMYPDFTRQATVGDLPLDFAATHYVGIAGVGLDAASYRRDDPATVHKRGILSYEGSASLDDVVNGRGTANTILMIQIPYDRGTGVSPWIAGGGATLRGVPEKNSIEPFILGKDRNDKIIQHEVKKGTAVRGTYALMADGSVRFIDQTISDEVFKAMCTVGGAAPPDFNPKTDPKTPLVPPPDSKEPGAKTPDKKPVENAPVEKPPPVEVKPPEKKKAEEPPPIDKQDPPKVKTGDARKLSVPGKFSLEAPAGFEWKPAPNSKNIAGKVFHGTNLQTKARLVLIATERTAPTENDRLIMMSQHLAGLNADFREVDKYTVTPKSNVDFRPPLAARVDIKFEGQDKDGKAIAIHTQTIFGKHVYLFQVHASTPAEAQSLLKSAETLGE